MICKRTERIAIALWCRHIAPFGRFSDTYIRYVDPARITITSRHTILPDDFSMIYLLLHLKGLPSITLRTLFLRDFLLNILRANIPLQL